MITEEDEGVYHCIVTNDDGSVVSDNATITVYGECCECTVSTPVADLGISKEVSGFTKISARSWLKTTKAKKRLQSAFCQHVKTHQVKFVTKPF